MSVPRERKLQILQASLLLPEAFFTPIEMGLLRNITHHYALGDEQDWGNSNQHRADEVRSLFEKCAACFTA